MSDRVEVDEQDLHKINWKEVTLPISVEGCADPKAMTFDRADLLILEKLLTTPIPQFNGFTGKWEAGTDVPAQCSESLRQLAVWAKAAGAWLKERERPLGQLEVVR